MKLTERIILTVITIIMFAGFFISLHVVGTLEKAGAELPVMINVSAGVVSLFGLSMLALAHTLEIVTDKASAWIFWGMIVLAYIGVVCDNMSWAIDGSVQYITLNYIMNMGGYLVMPIIMGLFWNYQNRVFIDESDRSKKVRRFVNIVVLADILFVIIGTAKGFLFYIDENGRYFGGKGFIPSHICPAIIIVCCVYENLRKTLPLQKKISLLAYGLVPVITLFFLIPFPQYSMAYVAFFANLILLYGTVQTKKEKELAEKTAKIAKQDMELGQQKTQIMISQIQPHFLYNTLTAIYHLCDTDAVLAKKTIQHFSSYLRMNMDSIDATQPIPFEKELEHTKTYLEIEMLRFGDILNVKYDIEVSDFEIPALTLQPLVENAVKYGIRSRENGGTVTISTKRVNGKIYLTVQDDGMGFDVNKMKKDGRSHLGIENTRRRLKQMVSADLIVDSRIGKGTSVTVVLEDKNESVTGR